MKKTRETIIGIVVVLLVVGVVYLVYQTKWSKVHKDLAKQIVELSPRGGPPETIEGLRKAIALYEAQIELNVKEAAQTGTYWKILGIRLADSNMHRDALDAFERALYFNDSDPTLFYLTGESAAVVAASVLGFTGNAETEKGRFSALAESAYLRAIRLDDSYSKPYFGLGFLYTFDLDRPADAIPHLERYLELASGDIKAMFVLARACYMTEKYDRAIELYDRIIARSKDPKVKAEAQNNKEIIQGIIYG